MQRTSGIHPVARPLARARAAGAPRRFRFWQAGTLAVLLLCNVCLAAQDRYDHDPTGRLSRHIDAQSRAIEYRYDPAGNILSVQSTSVDALRPILGSVAPLAVRRAASLGITLTGERLQLGTLTASHPGLQLSDVRRSADRLDAQLNVLDGVPLGAHTLSFSNSAGSAQVALQVLPALPTVNIEPSPLALPPDGVARQVVLRLSHADAVDHTVSLVSSDLSRGTVNPASLTLPAGQTTAMVSVTPKAAGFFSLNVGSTTLAPTAVPVFVTADFRGVNTSHAQSVGVRVGDVPAASLPAALGLFGAHGVGVSVGSVVTHVAPQGMPVGGAHALTIQGHGLPAGARLAVVPSTGATVTVNSAEGSHISATLQLTADAPAGWRRIEVRTEGGQLLPYASAASGLIRITTGQPELIAIAPLFSARNRVATIVLRGRHLQNGKVVISPGTDLRVDAEPTVSADGTEITARVHILPLAALGPRTVQVVTPSGTSTVTANAANQFTLVNEVQHNVTPIVSPLVGVRVGTPATEPLVQSFGPVLARAGVLVGQGATGLAPRVGVIGTNLTLEVQGHGLQSVQSVAVHPADGLLLGTPAPSPDGTRLTLPLAIAANAPTTPRRVVLTAASGIMSFAQAGSDQFSVVAPVPELLSTLPQVWLAGQTVAVTVRGTNLTGATAVQLLPSEGVTVSEPFNPGADGRTLTFNVQVAPGASSGARTLRITTLAGSSAAAASAANTITIAQQVGGHVTPIASPLVGVRVGQPMQQVATTGVLASAPLVGVLVNTAAEPAQRTETPHAAAVGVLVGPAARSVSPASPDGMLKGSTANVVVHGVGLGAVTGVALSRGGVSAGTPAASADGSRLSVPLTVASDAPSGAVGLRLQVPAGSGVSDLQVVDGSPLSVHVGALPGAISSISPIVIEQGKTVNLTVRGTGLRDVFAIELDPAPGVTVAPASGVAGVVWSTDAFGEKLTVPLVVGADAPIGSRVVRLRVPGAVTSSESLPANTLTIVAPQ